MSYNKQIAAYTTVELFAKAVDMADIMERAPHDPANKAETYSNLIAAIVTYHGAGNSTSITNGILRTAGQTGPLAKIAVDALS